MVTQNQVKNGVHKFINAELIAKMEDPIKTISGIGLELALMRSDNIFKYLKQNEFIKMLDIMDGDQIDIDAVYQATKKRMNGNSIIMPTNLFGNITFTTNDLDKLLDFIRQG